MKCQRLFPNGRTWCTIRCVLYRLPWSPLQIQIVTDFIDDFRQSKCLVVVDPVLGDNGKLYANFHDSMIKEMRQLVTKADVITPNLTELFYLLDLPYKEQNTDEELKSYLRQLSDKGPEVVIIPVFSVLNDIHKNLYTPIIVPAIAFGK